jgi:hypothetical protein
MASPLTPPPPIKENVPSGTNPNHESYIELSYNNNMYAVFFKHILNSNYNFLTVGLKVYSLNDHNSYPPLVVCEKIKQDFVSINNDTIQTLIEKNAKDAEKMLITYINENEASLGSDVVISLLSDKIINDIRVEIANLKMQKENFTTKFIQKAKDVLTDIKQRQNQPYHYSMKEQDEQERLRGGKAQITHSRTSEKIKCKDGVVRVVLPGPTSPTSTCESK